MAPALLGLLSLVYGPTTLAHAVVTASSLTTEPVKARHATRVALFFNSNVELSLSGQRGRRLPPG
jgi:copper resistance protein C